MNNGKFDIRRDVLINDLLYKLGKIPENTVGMHLCPYREERNKSFLILRDGKTFRDYSRDDKPQSLITLIDRLGIASIPSRGDSKGWYEFSEKVRTVMGVEKAYVAPKATITREVSKQKWREEDITDKRLVNYLISRGVGEAIIKSLSLKGELRQIKVEAKNGKVYTYIGLRNNNGGFVCRNSVMKSSVGKSGISKIVGKKTTFYISNSASNVSNVVKDIKENNIKESVIFEGFMDFLSFVSNKNMMGLLKAGNHNLALDNGLGGDRGTIVAQLELGIETTNDLRKNYKEYEDVNDAILNKKGIGKFPRFALVQKEKKLLLVKKDKVDGYPIAYEGFSEKEIMNMLLK